MSYSHTRLRKTLAFVRVVTGIVFLSLGTLKVGSLEFAKFTFPEFLDAAIRGMAVSWLRPMLIYILNYGPAQVGLMLGFIELTIGVALFLGLAVRPACLLGVMYSGWMLLATWHAAQGSLPMLQTANHSFQAVFPLLLFVLLAAGHAGETWGVGSLYHHHRARGWGLDAFAADRQPVVTRREKRFYDEYDEPAEAEQIESSQDEMLDQDRSA